MRSVPSVISQVGRKWGFAVETPPRHALTRPCNCTFSVSRTRLSGEPQIHIFDHVINFVA